MFIKVSEKIRMCFKIDNLIQDCLYLFSDAEIFPVHLNFWQIAKHNRQGLLMRCGFTVETSGLKMEHRGPN